MPDPRKKEENQSLISVHIGADGRVVQDVKHTDGSEEHSPLETDDWHGMAPGDKPHTMPRKATGALTEKKTYGLSRKGHTDRSCRVEAALIRTLPHNGRVLSDKDCRLILKEVLFAMGGQYDVEATKL